LKSIFLVSLGLWGIRGGMRGVFWVEMRALFIGKEEGVLLSMKGLLFAWFSALTKTIQPYEEEAWCIVLCSLQTFIRWVIRSNEPIRSNGVCPVEWPVSSVFFVPCFHSVEWDSFILHSIEWRQFVWFLLFRCLVWSCQCLRWSWILMWDPRKWPWMIYRRFWPKTEQKRLKFVAPSFLPFLWKCILNPMNFPKKLTKMVQKEGLKMVQKVTIQLPPPCTFARPRANKNKRREKIFQMSNAFKISKNILLSENKQNRSERKCFPTLPSL
jgi:hypothetical protein